MPKQDLIKKYSYLIGQKINKWTVLEIKNDRTKPDALCKCECGTVRLVNISNLIHNLSKDCGCGCGRKKMLSETKSKYLVGQKFGKLTVIKLLPETNKFNRRMYVCKCDCGNEKIVSSSSLTTNHTFSCGCINSYYNMYIGQYLKEQKIEYIPEYRVCIDNHQYRFDFYLPKYNLCIEYDGSQHYTPAAYSKNQKENEDRLKLTQIRDKIKNKYCKDNNINLLRIPYWESKNIKIIINDCLQRLSEKGFIA